MAAITWDNKPGYSQAQIEARWGKGARAVKSGGDKWVIKLPGGGAAQMGESPAERDARVAEESRASARDQAAGEEQQRNAAASAAAAPVAPSFTSAGAEAAIQAIRDQISALPGTFNAQRRDTFIRGQQQLGAGGLYDVFRDAAGNITGFTTRVEAAGAPSAEGSQNFRLSGGSEGQAFRDARSGVAANQAQAGAYFGSGRVDQQANAQASLNDSRQAFLTHMADTQTASGQQQASARSQLSGSLNEAEGNYADWRQQQLQSWSQQQMPPSAPSPVAAEPTSATMPGSAPAPAPAPAPAAVRPVWDVKPGYSAAQIKSRFGASASLVKAGNGKYTIKYG